MQCVTVSWPLVGIALALTAPRLVAELRNGWHSATENGGSATQPGDSES